MRASVPRPLLSEFLSCSALAELLCVNAEQLRQWLRLELLGQPECWRTIADARPNEPHTLWRTVDVVELVRRKRKNKKLSSASLCPACPFRQSQE